MACLQAVMFLPSCFGMASRLSSGWFDVLHFVLPFTAFVEVARANVVAAANALESFQSMVGQGLALIGGAYQRAPILVLVLSVLVILPAVALISLAAHARMRSRSRHAALRAAQRRAERGEIDETPGAAPAWPLQAWLTIEGLSSDTVPLAGQFVRIGRHEDNDIRLTDRSVHRHHAVIERTSEEVFVIADVSGKDGSGVRVNGAPTMRARLADGDVIELGRAKLRFENAPL
jgi:uncharacterized membrane protein